MTPPAARRTSNSSVSPPALASTAHASFEAPPASKCASASSTGDPSSASRLWRSSGAQGGTSARAGAEGTVEPDHLAVQIRVLDDVPNECRELLGPAEPGGERDLRFQRGADVVAEQAQHRRVLRPGRDRHHADRLPAELAG